MQPQSNQQYDFIMTPSKPTRGGMLPGLSGNSMIGRIVIIVGIGVVLIILLALASSLLGGSGNTPKLTIVAQEQSELLNLASLANTAGNSQASQANLDFTQSCLLSVTSAQNSLLSLLGSYNVKLSSKTLALNENPALNTEINNAVTASTFNTVYQQVMQSQLQLYESDIKSAFANTKNTTEKQLLSSEYQGAELLLKELDSPTQ